MPWQSLCISSASHPHTFEVLAKCFEIAPKVLAGVLAKCFSGAGKCLRNAPEMHSEKCLSKSLHLFSEPSLHLRSVCEVLCAPPHKVLARVLCEVPRKCLQQVPFKFAVSLQRAIRTPSKCLVSYCSNAAILQHPRAAGLEYCNIASSGEHGAWKAVRRELVAGTKV